jgi:hypothetical protein
MISNEELSFIVQGEVTELTKKTTESIRNFFPGSKIIISTWQNSDVNNLDFDDLILSKDPGGIKAKVNGGTVNLLRQIISTLTGLKNCKTDYAIKIRSDMAFFGNNLLHHYSKFKNFQRSKGHFISRVMILENGTLNPNNLYEMPFHFGDWFYFGKTKDLLKIFSINFSKEDELENAFYWKKRPFPINNINKKYFMRYRAETILTYFHISKKINLTLSHSNDVSSDNIQQSEFHLVNDYLLANMNNIQLINLKHINTSYLSTWVRYSFNEWLLLHKIFFMKKNIFFYKLIYKIHCVFKFIIATILYKLKFLK